MISRVVTLSNVKGGSRGLQRVKLKNVVVGGSGKVEGLGGGGGETVVTGTVEAQCPLKVQKLAHEVKVGGDV